MMIYKIGILHFKTTRKNQMSGKSKQINVHPWSETFNSSYKLNIF